MAEIKWIKIVTDMFDNRKIKQIEMMPDADAILVIWLKILCLAGLVNECGAIMFTPDIPYTEEMLAHEFDRPINTVRMALNMFERFGMIEIVDSVYCVTNWEKYQNVDGMEKIREQTRKRTVEYRNRLKLQEPNTSDVTVTSHVTHCDATDIDIDKEEDIDISVKAADAASTADRIDYAEVARLFHELCPSIKPTDREPKLTDKRKASIRVMVREVGRENLPRLFEQAEASDFLTGRDGAWNGCAFDWLINRNNAIKVLEGNYDNKQTKPSGPQPPAYEEWN